MLLFGQEALSGGNIWILMLVLAIAIGIIAFIRVHVAAEFPEPQHVVWFDSPFRASWVVALLIAPYHQLWAQKLSSSGLSRSDREQLQRARATLGEQLGIPDWNAALAAARAPRGQRTRWQFPISARTVSF